MANISHKVLQCEGHTGPTDLEPATTQILLPGSPSTLLCPGDHPCPAPRPQSTVHTVRWLLRPSPCHRVSAWLRGSGSGDCCFQLRVFSNIKSSGSLPEAETWDKRVCQTWAVRTFGRAGAAMVPADLFSQAFRSLP